MIETTRPMSKGRAPVQVGVVSVTTDSYFSPATNREVSFPNYPLEAKGYITDGYGLDTIDTSGSPWGGNVFIQPNGYTERQEIIGSDEFNYRTPKFLIGVIEDDVINKQWRGVEMTLTAQMVTTVYSYIEPGPPVIISITNTPQTFTYTFTSADDPMVGGTYYIAPNQTSNPDYPGTEYLFSSIVYSSTVYPIAYITTDTSPTNLQWVMTSTIPP